MIFSCGAPAADNSGNRPVNAPANSANSAAAETDIKKSIADVYTALAKNDTAALDKLYDDKYVVVDVDGSVKNKTERLAELRSGDVKFESISADEISVRVNPEGTGAVSIARATVKAVNRGVATDGHVRVTTIWSKTKDGWKTVGVHATRITATEAPKAPANANAPANK